MAVLQIDWVNNGLPFELTPEHITPRIERDLRLVRGKAKIRAAKEYGITDETPRSVVESMWSDILVEAHVAATEFLFRAVLCEVDESGAVKDMTPSEVRDRLTMEEWQAINKALTVSKEESGDEDSDEGVEFPLDESGAETLPAPPGFVAP